MSKSNVLLKELEDIVTNANAMEFIHLNDHP
jgi:hypothetical protein